MNFNYYMFRDGDGVAYLGNDGTMRMVTDPENVLKGDARWGFSHEVGHVMQMRPMTPGRHDRSQQQHLFLAGRSQNRQ